MVATLQEMIETSRTQGEEAQRQAALAKQATEQAEEARKQAENARREGMLSAAQQLEDVVKIIASASNELEAHIGQANHLSSESALRLGDAATAMNQMNATVREVASNASSPRACLTRPEPMPKMVKLSYGRLWKALTGYTRFRRRSRTTWARSTNTPRPSAAS